MVDNTEIAVTPHMDDSHDTIEIIFFQGMIFLHDSELHTHGNLKSSNCVVNSRWTLQVTDCGLYELRSFADEDNEYLKYRRKFC